MLTPSIMLRSSLMTSGAVSTMWRSDENPAPTSSIARRMPRAAQRRRARRQGVVVLHLVVLGELQQDPVQRQPLEQLGAAPGVSSVAGEMFIAM